MTRLTDPEQLSALLGIPFSDQQLAAIAAPLQPGVIIAGAGSGKTTVMAARVVWLAGSGAVRPDQVLGLTFTRKAAGELSQRVRAALTRAGITGGESSGLGEGEELVLTYDAFAGRLVAEHGLLLGIEPGARMITGAARFRLAARVVADPPLPLRHLSRLRPDSVTERVVELAGELRSHLVPPERLADHAESFLADLDTAPRTRQGEEYVALAKSRAALAERLELTALVMRYEELKEQLGYVEFADQMAQAARLATGVPSVAEALRSEFVVVLLDEYQDTSAAQAQLLRGLFSGPDPARGRGHPVTAVGDPCQAIYGWRGAAASNILQFSTDFPTADGGPTPAYALTVNRRSGQRILDAANVLAAPIRAVTALSGLDLDLVCPPSTPAARIETAEFDTWPEEVGWLADQAVALHDGGAVARWSDMAVLTRRNSHIARIYSALSARGVPAEIVGLGGLLDLPAVAEVVATLRLLADPSDNPALVRLLTSPRWAIGLADLLALGRRAVQLAGRPEVETSEASLEAALRSILAGTDPTALPSLLEAVNAPGDSRLTAAARERFAAFAAEFAGLRRSSSQSVLDLTVRVIETLGVEAELRAEGEDTSQLAAFVEAVAGYSGIDGESSLSGLLAWFEAEREYGVGLDQSVVSQADSVKLLTVHKAKGLEWDVVFLPALAADVFPSDRVTGNWLGNASVLPNPLRGDALSVPQLGQITNDGFKRFADALRDEQRLAEDRLAYVAVTRARRLVLASSHLWDVQLVRPRQPSDYLGVLIDHADTVREPESVSQANPLALAEGMGRWPVVDDSAGWRRRREAAALVNAARAHLAGPAGPVVRQASLAHELTDLDLADQVAAWRGSREALLAQALADSRRVPPVPDYLSVTGIGRLLADPAGFAADLARPMPRLVGAEQRAGIGFHRWLEHRFSAQSPLGDELEAELTAVDEHLRDAFLAGPYADAVPVAVEVPFTMTLAGRLVRGRIDAVFPSTGRYRFQVVDWKTGWVGRAAPLQLAYYRLAWAELQGVPPDEVDAVFYEVASGSVSRPPALPGRAELEAELARVGTGIA